MAGSCPPVFDRAIGPAASASRSNCAVLRGETTFPQVARLEGLEPPAGCLEGSCSIRLSYRRLPNVLCRIQVTQRTHRLDTAVITPADPGSTGTRYGCCGGA